MASSTELIEKLNSDVLGAYDAIAAKGGTVPENKNTDNLASAVESIPAGGGRPPLPEYPYPVEEFDGGEYGAVAYLRDDTVHYYTATSADDLNNLTGSAKSRMIKTFEDGFTITTDNVLAYAVGSTTTTLGGHFLQSCPLLQTFYFAKEGSLTQIGTYFLYDDNNFNAPMDIPETVTSIGTYFLADCDSFNQPVTLPPLITIINDNFLYACPSFNQPISVPDKVTRITNSFLSNCLSFNSVITLPDGMTSIGEYFLNGCGVYNQPLVLPDTITNIAGTNSSSGLLSRCISFNQPFSIPASATNTGYGLLNGCTSFNSPITLRSPMTQISPYFLNGCSSFNQPISIPPAQKSIPTNFLTVCTSFNQPITIPDSVTEIGGSFLVSCISFNQPLTVSDNVTTIGASFLSGCRAFNQPISLLGAKTIGDNFLQNCTDFNQPISLPSATSLGRYFLNGCSSFAQPFTLADTIFNVSEYFLYNCNNFVGPLDVGKASGYYTSSYMLSTTSSTAPMYTTGVTLVGENAEAVKLGWPDRTTSPYRKLIVEGTEVLNFAKAVKAGTAKTTYPVGTEIPDKYDGQDNPLIVAQYLDSTNNSAYDGAEGVICVRKYAAPWDTSWNTRGGGDYPNMTIKTEMLDVEYPSKCSAATRSVVSEINIPFWNSREITQVPSTWFLMSECEVGGATVGHGDGSGSAGNEGFFWDYWKQVTGLSSANGGANAGRQTAGYKEGESGNRWLRSYFASAGAAEVIYSSNGSIQSSSSRADLFPACFISSK